MRIYCMRFPEGKAKALTLSYDDGVYSDIRFAEIINRYGLKATFNLNGGRFLPEDKKDANPTRRLTSSEAIAFYTNSGHEVACHGYLHNHATELPLGPVAYEFAKDREVLETMFKRVVRGMAYAYGNYSDEVVNAVRASGIVYGRTTKQSESFSMPQDWLRLESTCHHNNHRLMELAENFLSLSLRPSDTVRMFYVWGHTYEFERMNNWEVIENFAAYVGGKEDIWYATNIEIYEYVEAYHRLVFSADMTRVYNPTVVTLFISADNGELFRVAPGETVVLE